MGMYDSILVSQSLIERATEGTDIKFKPHQGFCDFQTKDLDNTLNVYYIESDGSFFWKKQEYRWIDPVLSNPTNRKYNFGHMEPVGEPEMIEDTRTAYIDFYDLYATEFERIFVTFTAHVKCGKLIEPIAIKSIERTNLVEEAEETKKIREKWKKVEATWQWRVASAIQEIKWFFMKWSRPFTSRLNELERNLREQARKMYDLPY